MTANIIIERRDYGEEDPSECIAFEKEDRTLPYANLMGRLSGHTNPARLTPKTKRPSKALKGLAVHDCTHRGCGKVSETTTPR